MVAAMYLVKAAPLLRSEGAESGMIQQNRLAAKSLFGVAEHCIHGDQSVIEVTERIVSDSRLRRSVFRRFQAGREAADAQYIKAAEAMPKTTWFRFVLAGVESAQ